MRITKTDYMEYTMCPKNLWLKKHKPGIFEDIEITEFQKEIILNGQIVDEASMHLFPDGKLVNAENNVDQLDYSKELLAKRNGTIFQASFEWNGFFVRTDILHFDKQANSWSLYEVKATNSVKTSPYSHIKDLAFQKLLLKYNDIDISHIGVIHLNSVYRRSGELNYDDLFQETDVTIKVNDAEGIVNTEMNDLKNYLKMPEKQGCGCLYKGRTAQCKTFAYSNPHIADYSVHNISRIGSSKKILADWINRNIYSIEDIDNPQVLKGYRHLQYIAHIGGEAIVNSEEILNILNDLEFPIHFLDYEAYSSAIPAFDRFGPWQHIPFQYSIHILNDDGSLEHREFLIKKPTNEITHSLVDNLAKDVHDTGTIVVWYAPFEKARNNYLALLYPEFSDFISNLNNRIFDLMKIFSDGHYVDPGFRGSNSLKNVLPVLVPDLLYTDLEIQKGIDAPVYWKKMISEKSDLSEIKDIEKQLLEYCKLDTFAMVRIYEFLKNL